MPEARHSEDSGAADVTAISMESVRDMCYNAILSDPTDNETRAKVDKVIEDLIEAGFKGICHTEGMDTLLCEPGVDGKNPIDALLEKCRAAYTNANSGATKKYPMAARTAEDIARDLAGTHGRRQSKKGYFGLAAAGAVFLGALSFSGIHLECQRRHHNHMVSLPTVQYIVQPGDTFYRLSERFISDKDKYEKQEITHHVMQMNSFEDASRLRPGDRIQLPVEDMTAEQVRELGGR